MNCLWTHTYTCNIERPFLVHVLILGCALNFDSEMRNNYNLHNEIVSALREVLKYDDPIDDFESYKIHNHYI